MMNTVSTLAAVGVVVLSACTFRPTPNQPTMIPLDFEPIASASTPIDNPDINCDVSIDWGGIDVSCDWSGRGAQAVSLTRGSDYSDCADFDFYDCDYFDRDLCDYSATID